MSSDSNEKLPFEDIKVDDRYSTDFYDRFPQYYAVYMRHSFTQLAAHFILTSCERWGLPKTSRGLSFGCGPALYAIDLASLNIWMYAMDLSQGMLDYARSQAELAGVAISFHQGNMLEWRTPEPVDFALNLGENLSYLMTADEMLANFDAAADSLNPGGLYFCQLSVPVHHWATGTVLMKPPWVVYAGLQPGISQETIDGAEVSIQFNGKHVFYDPWRQVFLTEIAIEVTRDGNTERFEKTEAHRVFYPLEFEALVASSGRFEVCGMFYDFSVDAPLQGNPQATAYIAVLRRKP